jgi:glycosyltransferase involved in cell wall biosynthesis
MSAVGASSIPLDAVMALIPALNEADALPGVLAALRQNGVSHIRVVDNGSSDGTGEVARLGGAEVVLEPKRGYGQACWRGLQDIPASIGWILFVDADACDDLSALPHFFAAAAHGEDLVLSNRLARHTSRAALTPQQRWGNTLATTLIRLGWGHAYQDLGPLRLVRRSLLDRIGMQDRGFGWTVEMQIRAVEVGARIVELDVDYFRRKHGRSKIAGTLSGTIKAGTVILSTVARLRWQRWRGGTNRSPSMAAGQSG